MTHSEVESKLLYAREKVRKAPGVWRTANSARDYIRAVTGLAKCANVARSAKKLLYMGHFWQFRQCDLAAQIAQTGLWPMTNA